MTPAPPPPRLGRFLDVVIPIAVALAAITPVVIAWLKVRPRQ